MSESRKPPSFTCPRCGATSCHPKDVEFRYCGRCHAFVDDAWRAPAQAAPADHWRCDVCGKLWRLDSTALPGSSCDRGVCRG